MSPVHDSPLMPPQGLVSRTVFTSPVVDRILTGRIRPSATLDAIFVGRRSITVKECSADGQLSNVACVSNFASPIIRAHVLGKRLIAEEPTLNGIKLEPLEDDGSAVLDGRKHAPSHKLAVLLEDGELVFLTLHPSSSTSSSGRQLHARHECQALPPAHDVLEDWRFLAVDPNSRAISVAAWNGKVVLLTLTDACTVRSMRMLDTGMSLVLMEFLFPDRDDENTIILLLVGRKSGRFHFLLYRWDLRDVMAPTAPQVVLIDPPRSMPSFLIPLHIVPGAFLLASQHHLSIYINANSGCITHHLDLTHLVACASLTSQNAESAVERPPWSNWTRASRWWARSEDLWLTREDGVVLFISIGLGNESSNKYADFLSKELNLRDSGEPGCLEGIVGGAFSSFDPLDHRGRGPDIILFSGELSDGAHFVIGQPDRRNQSDSQSAAMPPVKKESFHNWAPFLDVVAVPRRVMRRESDRHLNATTTSIVEERPEIRNRIFGTSGKGAWGAVCELRWGRELTINSSLRKEDWLRGADNVWTMHNPHLRWRFNFVSTPFSTLQLSWEDDQVHSVSTLAEEPTLTMMLLEPLTRGASPDAIVHVTPSSINLLIVQQGAQMNDGGDESDENTNNDNANGDFSCHHVHAWDHQHRVTSATVDQYSGIIVLTMLQSGEAYLVVKRLRHTGARGWIIQQLGSQMPCCEEPICVEIFGPSLATRDLIKRENGVDADWPCRFVAFGTGTGDLYFAAIDPAGGLERLTKFPPQDGGTCQSLCVLSSSDWQGYRVIAGQRNGKLVVRELTIDSKGEPFQLGLSRVFDFGPHPISVRSCSDGSELGCLIYGGPDTCFLNLADGRLHAMTLDQVWLTNRANRSLKQPQLSAIFSWPYGDGVLASIIQVVCLTADGDIYDGTLSRSTEPLPRRIPVAGTPSRLFYSKYLQCLVVASTEVITDPTQHKRYAFAVLTLVDPDGEIDESELDLQEAEQGEATYRSQQAFRFPHVGERITCLCEWHCRKGESTHNLLAVGTTATNGQGEEVGYIRLLQSFRSSTNARELRHIKTCAERKPVRAICTWDSKTLLYCTGTEIRKRTLTLGSDVALIKVRLCDLSSPGIYLDCHNTGDLATSFVTVTTQQGGTRVFQFNEDATVLHYYTSTNEASLGLAHITLRQHGLVISSSKDQMITGFALSNSAEELDSREPMFHAKMPASLTRFIQDTVRPPWKQSGNGHESIRDLLGVATDGTLVSMRVVDLDTWRLLRFVVNLALRDSRLADIGHARYDGHRHKHIEPDDSDPEAYHVDGDILARLVARSDPGSVLTEMLMSAPELSEVDTAIDFGSAEARRERFDTLVVEAARSMARSDNVDAGRTVDAAANDSISWTIELLRSTLELPF